MEDSPENHIQLCAEGARLMAESLRQKDGDARGGEETLCVFCSPQGLHFLFENKGK